MTELTEKKCLACESGVPPLTKEAIEKLLQQIPHWNLNDNKNIFRKFDFKNFYKTMGFVNAVAYIANQENHHPDMEVGYNYCIIKYTTHAIQGLSENDFICAAKIDKLI